MKEFVDFILNIHSHLRPGLFICISTRRKNKWKDHFFETPLDREILEDFFNNYDTNRYDLYFCPHAFKNKQRRETEAVPTKYLWSDLDNANPNSVHPKPNIAWESSPNRYACLWILKETPSLEETKNLNKKLAYANGADRSGWDITQVLRIPGSRNHKYADSPRGRLLWSDPKPYEDIVPMEGFNQSATDILALHKISPFLIKKLYSEAVPGKRSEVLWKLENLLYEKGLNREEIKTVIKDSPWNKFVKREKQLDRELDKLKEIHPELKEGEVKKKKEPKKLDHITLVPLTDIEPEVVDWLWYPYIPFGKITIIEGDPGLGKSWLTMSLAKTIAEGTALPYNPAPIHKGKVIIMSAEDGLADTIKPRLKSLGSTGINILAIPEPFSFTPGATEAITDMLKEIKPKLIIIDPLVAYMGGGIDLHKANETRTVMSRLAQLAEHTHAAVVCVRHLSKGAKDKAIYRGIGSIDLTAAARSCLAIGRNPEDPNESRVICHIKSNLAPMGKPISYYLRPGNKQEPFAWGEQLSVDVNKVLNQEPTNNKGQIEEAVEFLENLLSQGELSTSFIKREAEAKGVTWEMIRKARKELNVITRKSEDEILWRL